MASNEIDDVLAIFDNVKDYAQTHYFVLWYV